MDNHLAWLPRPFPKIGDQINSAVENKGFPDPTYPYNHPCYVLHKDLKWCVEGLQTPRARIECREELLDVLECKTHGLKSHRAQQMREKYNDKIRNGWIPPSGEVEYRFLQSLQQKQRPVKPTERFETLSKIEYLEQIRDGAKPNLK